MKILIAGGTGFIGQSLIKRFLAQNKQITVLGRNYSKIKRCFGDQVDPLDWDDFKRDDVQLCKDQDVIINLCGARIGSKRWTEKRKQTIISSRVNTSLAIAKACAKLGNQAPRWLNASAVGIYGLQTQLKDEPPLPFTELSNLHIASTDFLSKVAHAWEETTLEAETAGVNVIKLRFGVVLAKHGGALAQIALPFKLFVGGRIGSGKQPFAWIALADLISAFNFILDRPKISGAINLVAPHCIVQQQLAKALGKTLHRPSLIPTPGWALKLMFGEMADALLLNGQQVAPKRLLELGFKFKYPKIDSALTQICHPKSGR